MKISSLFENVTPFLLEHKIMDHEELFQTLNIKLPNEII